jgi:periplasmic copper chaperone A
MRWIAPMGALIFAMCSAQAQDYHAGNLTIGHPWARPIAGPNKIGAAYLSIMNAGQLPDKLEAASSPEAGKAEIHEHAMDANGIMRMRPVQGGLLIPAGGTIEFKPGGYHIMLMGLKHNLEDGAHIPLKLTFERAGPVDVEVNIEKQPQGASSMHDHKS